MAASIDLDAIVRRLKPEKHKQIARRDETKLAFVDSEPLAGAPLLLDTGVYIHVLRGKTPSKVDELLRTRTIYHSATAISELTNRLGSRLPADTKQRAARRILMETIRDIPTHRIVSPTAQLWIEGGILAGIRARIGGFQEAQAQDALNDALIFLQARDVGAAVLTANLVDFDILHQ